MEGLEKWAELKACVYSACSGDYLHEITPVWPNKPGFRYRLMAHGTMEEKIYKRRVTKEGLAARVVDRQQVHRTISKEEMLHLFEFGDDENHELGQDKGCSDQNMTGEVEIFPKHKVPLSQGSCSSDKLMEGLLGKHYPRWIANFHEHETLLQENEEEKLSKEEQDMAWEVYRRALEWEEVQRVPLNESAVDRKPAALNVASSAPEMSSLAELKAKDISVQRKCTNLSHLLTLRSQGTKIGCTTVCGECGREICWKDLHRDGRLARCLFCFDEEMSYSLNQSCENELSNENPKPFS